MSVLAPVSTGRGDILVVAYPQHLAPELTSGPPPLAAASAVQATTLTGPAALVLAPCADGQ